MNPFAMSLLLALLVSGALNAKLVRLFDNGKLDSSYAAKIESLKEGDFLEYPDGARFQFLKILGEGNAATVLQVRALSSELSMETFALRIPKAESDIYLTKKHMQFLDYTIDNYEKVKAARIRIPKLYRSSSKLYAQFEEIPEEETLKKYLRDPDNEGKPQAKEKMIALKIFARSMKDIRTPGDFRTDQIVYNPEEKEWVLLDWAVARDLQELTGRELFRQTPFVESDFISSTPNNPWAMRVIEELHQETARARKGDFRILCRSILTGIADLVIP